MFIGLAVTSKGQSQVHMANGIHDWIGTRRVVEARKHHNRLENEPTRLSH